METASAYSGFLNVLHHRILHSGKRNVGPEAFRRISLNVQLLCQPRPFGVRIDFRVPFKRESTKTLSLVQRPVTPSAVQKLPLLVQYPPD